MKKIVLQDFTANGETVADLVSIADETAILPAITRTPAPTPTSEYWEKAVLAVLPPDPRDQRYCWYCYTHQNTSMWDVWTRETEPGAVAFYPGLYNGTALCAICEQVCVEQSLVQKADSIRIE